MTSTVSHANATHLQATTTTTREAVSPTHSGTGTVAADLGSACNLLKSDRLRFFRSHVATDTILVGFVRDRGVSYSAASRVTRTVRM